MSVTNGVSGGVKQKDGDFGAGSCSRRATRWCLVPTDSSFLKPYILFKYDPQNFKPILVLSVGYEQNESAPSSHWSSGLLLARRQTGVGRWWSDNWQSKHNYSENTWPVPVLPPLGILNKNPENVGRKYVGGTTLSKVHYITKELKCQLHFHSQF